MLSWIQENAEIIRIATSVVTALVWLVYLQILVHTFRRQRRSSLLINRGGAKDLNARCLVSNMASQPVYLQDVLAEVTTGSDRYTASVVDRSELGSDDVERPEDSTSQGPVQSGHFVDIGSFHDILNRAEKSFGGSGKTDEVEGMTLIAVAASNQAQNIVAACRDFEISRDEDSEALMPRSVQTKQIRNWRKRRELTRILEELERKRATREGVGSRLGTARPSLHTG